MVRVLLALLSFFCGVAAIACALLVPSHLRSIDEQVLVEIGRNGPTVADAGLQLLPDKVSSAKVLAKVADQLNLTRTLRFTSAIQAAEDTGRAWRNSPFHSPEFQNLLGGPADYEYLSKTTFLEGLRNRATRQKFKKALLPPEAQRVLQNLTRTNAVLFAPVNSAGGCPFDVAVTTTAMLIDDRAIGATPTSLIKDEVLNLVSRASRTNANPALEEFYLNVFAMAKRMSWEQM